jgi:hypothetical protein
VADTTEKTAEGCTVEWLGVGDPCRAPDAVAYVTGCVREHMEEDRYCEMHAGQLLAGALLCTECWALGERVRVAALGLVLPSGERVRVLNGAAS